MSSALNTYANSIDLTSDGWINGTNVVKTTAPTPKTYTVNLPAFQTSGGDTFTNHKTTVTFSTQSVQTPLKSVEVDATGEYNGGWDAARAKVSTPSAGTTDSFSVGVPSATRGEGQTLSFSMTKGATPAPSGYASVTLGQTGIARIPIGDWYTAGVNSVALTTGSFDTNGTKNPPSGYSGFSSVTISVPTGYTG